MSESAAGEPARVPDPFGLTANPAAYHPTRACERALAQLERSLYEHPVVALTGPPGLGKTLLLRILAGRVESRFRVSSVPYPALSPFDLCALALELLDHAAGDDPIGRLTDHARELALQGSGLVLLIDDASTLPLRTAHRLAELVASEGGALRLVLVALDGNATESVLRVFGRDVMRVELMEGIDVDETAGYVEAHLAQAGAPAEVRALFGGDASRELHRLARGVPRSLNVLAQQWMRIAEESQETRGAFQALRAVARELGTGEVEEKSEANAVVEEVLAEQAPASVQASDAAGSSEPSVAQESMAPVEAPSVESAAPEPSRAFVAEPPARGGLWRKLGWLGFAAGVALGVAFVLKPWQVMPPSSPETSRLPGRVRQPAPKISKPRPKRPTPTKTAPTLALPEPRAAVAPRFETRDLEPEITIEAPRPALPTDVGIEIVDELEHVTPEPSAPPVPVAAPVAVSINATPWAIVAVDGRELGETPLAGVELVPGPHTFRARMPDGSVRERVVEIDASERFVVFE